MISDDGLKFQDSKAQQLLDYCRRNNFKICCAESLTGGLLADAFVRISGASQVFRGSVNTYAVETKTDILGVDENYLNVNGPVNAYTASNMALGALKLFSCKGISLSTTGVAGPGPQDDIPAGTFYIGCAFSSGRTYTRRFYCEGDRESVRRRAVLSALEYGMECVSSNVKYVIFDENGE